ncbi:hypothetical protein [Paenibacillus tianmuensis]|uniref:hypothetical protein n=1 Tax=Paenibacillus tianmuensis TaxID=624147 RepID=UPI001FDF6113|nr:hypothetical protein [Paenibacillus tianmuensis]
MIFQKQIVRGITLIGFKSKADHRNFRSRFGRRGLRRRERETGGGAAAFAGNGVPDD